MKATRRKIIIVRACISCEAATSGRDEPFTFLRLGSYLEERPLDDGSQFVADAYRLAADRDFLPAIVNLSVYASDNPAFRLTEAYLHYGFNLEATDGRWHIIGPLINFYLLTSRIATPKAIFIWPPNGIANWATKNLRP